MNERIKELAEQASHQNPDGYSVTIPYSKDFAKKFAALVARECIEVCGSVAAVRAGYNDADGRDTAYSCGDQIKEHFGIES
jgi:hypothetical protein